MRRTCTRWVPSRASDRCSAVSAGVQLLLQGEYRASALHLAEHDGYLEAVVREAEDQPPLDPDDAAFLALYKEARERAAELGQKSGLPEEMVQQVLASVTDVGRFADMVAGYLDAKTPERQALLETLGVEERLRRVLILVQRQIGVIRGAGGHQVAGPGGARRAAARDVPA